MRAAEHLCLSFEVGCEGIPSGVLPHRAAGGFATVDSWESGFEIPRVEMSVVVWEQANVEFGAHGAAGGRHADAPARASLGLPADKGGVMHANRAGHHVGRVLGTAVLVLVAGLGVGCDGKGAWWTLDEPPGSTIAHDWVGGDDAVVQAGAAFVAAAPGCTGNALQIDGVSGYAEAPDSPDLRFAVSDDFTISAWVYLPQKPDVWGAIFEKSRETGAWYGLWVSGLDYYRAFVFGGVDHGDIHSGSGTALPGWHLVAGVQDGAAGVRTLYVDGQAVATGAALAADGTGVVRIGETPPSADEPPEVLNGMVADARIYPSALSADRIAQLYDQGCRPWR